MVAHYWVPAVQLWLLFMAAGAFLVGMSIWAFRKHPMVAILCSLVFCFCLGGALAANASRHDWKGMGNQRANMTVRLTETPQPRERSWRTKAEVLMMDGRSATGELLLFLRKDSVAASLRYGDRLLLQVTPDVSRPYIYTTSDHYTIVQHDSTSLRARSEALRMRLLHRVQQGPLPTHRAALAEALVLGWRADLTDDTRISFQGAGIAHLLSVSGLHVGLLTAIVGWLMVWVGRGRKGRMIRGIVQLLAVWIFALLTGMSPSTVRASLMFSLFIVADFAERRTPRMNLLAAVAIFTLVFDPMLLFDVGWQLSYAAVAGILLARPVIYASRNRIWQAATVSVAATLATLPVVISTFHRLPVYFLVANIVLVPLSALLLLIAILYVAFPGGLVAWPMGKAAAFTEWVTSRVTALPGAVVDNLYPSVWGMGAITISVLALLIAAQWLGHRDSTRQSGNTSEPL